MSLSSEIAAWNEKRKQELIANYDRLDFRASGKFARELKPSQQITPFSIKVRMLGTKHSIYMINGRKPGKMPPISAMRKWIDDKNINPKGITKDQLAFLIARKIGKEGVKPSPQRKRLISDVYTRQRIEELIDIIGKNTLFELRNATLKLLNNGN